MHGFSRSSSLTSLLPSSLNFLESKFSKSSHTLTISSETRPKLRPGPARTAFLIPKIFPQSPRFSPNNRNQTAPVIVWSYSPTVLNRPLPSPPVVLMTSRRIPSTLSRTKRLSIRTVPEMLSRVDSLVLWRLGSRWTKLLKLVTLWVLCVLPRWDRSTNGQR